MSSEEAFAKGLAAGFASPAVRKLIEKHARPSFVVGDGTEMVLGDFVMVPERFGGRRAGQWAEVIKLSEDGLGLRFQEKIGGVTREFLEWDDLMGARATAAPRDRKRLSVMPPTPPSPSI